jgi:hypothetical protein
MLNVLRSRTRTELVADELRIRDLLDDPALRRSMGLAPVGAPGTTWASSGRQVHRPILNLRRLLDDAAA